MVPAILEPPVSRFDSHFTRLALIGALAAALGLAGCGRKGALDPPPGASMEGQPQAYNPKLMRGVPQPSASAPIGAQSAPENPGVDAEGRPLAPTGPNKRIPLDNLLN